MFNIFTAIRRITTYHQGTESNSRMAVKYFMVKYIKRLQIIFC